MHFTIIIYVASVNVKNQFKLVHGMCIYQLKWTILVVNATESSSEVLLTLIDKYTLSMFSKCGRSERVIQGCVAIIHADPSYENAIYIIFIITIKKDTQGNWLGESCICDYL